MADAVSGPWRATSGRMATAVRSWDQTAVHQECARVILFNLSGHGQLDVAEAYRSGKPNGNGGGTRR